MTKGKKNWVFCDGYLPPHGDNPDFEGDSIYYWGENGETGNVTFYAKWDEITELCKKSVEIVKEARN